MDQIVSFPKHDINPKEKGEKWCLQAAKAIVNNWATGMQTGSIFYAKRLQYQEIDSYYMAMQSAMRYLEWQTGEKNPASIWINTDQTIDGLVKTHIQKILGRLKKIEYNINATPLDSTAKSKLDEWYDQMYIKIMMREAAMKQNPAYAQNPALAKEDGEPEDVEELKLAKQFSPKFIRAKDIEQAIGMLFYENEMEKLVELWDEDNVKYGVCVGQEGIDENNKVFIKRIAPADFVCSYSETGNFDKLTHAGFYERVTLGSLTKYFDDTTLAKIADATKGKNGNPQYYNTSTARGWDPFKVEVFNFEMLSYNTVATEERKNKFGNKRFGKTDYNNIGKPTPENKVVSAATREEVYKGKWIVGTDYIFDYGKATNTKRSMDKEKVGKTSLSFIAFATMFDKMRARGIMEDLIPVADEIQMVVAKMRTLRNTMITNGIAIDFSALEGVALGEGGKNLSPKEILDMFLQNGVLAYRSENLIQDGKMVQRKPVEPVVMNGAAELAGMWNDYQNLTGKLYEISGLNQTTDSATVNPKMLNGVARLQNAGTNNALYFLENARRKFVEKVARNIIPRFQTALLIGDYDGYAQAIGQNTIEYFKFAATQFPCDYSIIIEDRPTDEQKQVVYEMMREEIKQGFLTTADVFAVIDAYNLKDAQVILEARSRKNREKKEQFALQQQQMNGKVQTESALAVEDAKQKTLDKEYDRKMDIEKEITYRTLEVERMRLGGAGATTIHNNLTKLATSAMSNPEQAAPPTMTPEAETEAETIQEQGVEEPVMAG
jgi:hypothetical protein